MLLGLLAGLATAPMVASAATPLSAEDAAWLRRASFGLDSATVAQYQTLGRAAYLQAALHPGHDPLPAAVQAELQAMPALSTPMESMALQLGRQQQQIRSMADGQAKTALKQSVQQQANDFARQARQAELLRAVYGSDSLYEQMVWFWLNHFSVDAAKARDRWAIADYEEHVIRPRALGHFSDLVMATLQSPAMLEYLDNAQNARGKVNENYARELMELHTLGVGAGYSQQDVQQLALVLTGAGLAPYDHPARALPAHWQAQQVRQGLFEFNPARHDFSDKILLGQPIKGRGYDEIRQAVDIIVSQPACARFISTRLATYFLGERPPDALIQQMATRFIHSNGDIAKVLQTLFESPQMAETRHTRFEDPMQFVVSSVRLYYDGAVLTNPQPLVNWLDQLGEPLYGRSTPDGWPLDSAAWSSSGQLAKRFEIARAIGSGRNGLQAGSNDPHHPAPAIPDLSTRPPYLLAMAATLSPAAHAALEQAKAIPDRNTYLLASPDFNSR